MKNLEPFLFIAPDLDSSISILYELMAGGVGKPVREVIFYFIFLTILLTCFETWTNQFNYSVAYPKFFFILAKVGMFFILTSKKGLEYI